MLFMPVQPMLQVVLAWDDYNYKPLLPLYFAVWDQKYTWEGVTDAEDGGRYMEGHAWRSGNMSETIVIK